MTEFHEPPGTVRRKFVRAAIWLGCAVLAGLAVTGFNAWRQRQPAAPLIAADGAAAVVAMDFSAPLWPGSLPRGWWHRTFWTRPAMTFGVVTKDGVPALRCATQGSASMLVRWTDIDVTRFPTLTWRWLVERPLASDRDERTREGDDHPVRFFLAFADDDGAARHAEIVWANRAFKRGDWKTIGAFPHYVADGGDENIGRWR
ncbi:MAG: DUF3047 domain-containing protein, partial [Hyphomonadaceae bacterium]|nr:DUF3047 domain-containing protein [Hyphomonadaceae bacterium]